MTTIDIQDVERDVIGTLRQVEGGETFVILQANRPVAEIKPISASPLGLFNGEFASPDDADDPADRAREFYERELRAKLEASNLNQYVAIHPETWDYAVKPQYGKALRAMRALHPTGPIVLQHIGLADSGFGARLRGERHGQLRCND